MYVGGQVSGRHPPSSTRRPMTGRSGEYRFANDSLTMSDPTGPVSAGVNILPATSRSPRPWKYPGDAVSQGTTGSDDPSGRLIPSRMKLLLLPRSVGGSSV